MRLPGKPNALCFLTTHRFWSTYETCLGWVSERPSFEKRSRPIIGLWLSSTHVTLTSVASQSTDLHLTQVLLTPRFLIKSFEKVLSSCISADCTQKLSLQSDTTAFTRLLVMIVQTLPESTKAFVLVFPKQMFTFTDSTSLMLSLDCCNKIVIKVIIVRIVVCTVDTVFLKQSIKMIDLLSYKCWSTHRRCLEDSIINVVYSGLWL